MGQDTNYDSIFGKLVVEHGLCTDEELAQSIDELKKRQRTNPILLKDLMVELGYITLSQSERLKDSIKETKDQTHQIPGYKILGKLGAGAMAIVYKAQQISLDRIVAIKVLPKQFSENPEYVQRFYKEGKAAAKLNHNNIVQAIDVGEAGGYHYFVMEYVEGKTLYDDLSKGKVFSENEAVEVMLQVAHALEHAHAVNLIHRDVKPKNIMINKAGVVKLADMGLARATTDIEAAKTEAGKAYGTPYYIAPEQIRGEMDIDGRADIYSLGATFYHLVTGKVPFMADDPAEVMRKHLKEALVPPDHINTSLSAGVSEVIETMMAKRKEDRYRNIKELIEDLEAVNDGMTPPYAHKQIDLKGLEKLAEGEEIVDEEQLYEQDLINKYKMTILALSIVCGISIIGIVILLVVKL